MINLISACSINGIIGLEGILPWQGKYSGDLKYFREKTKGSTIIMGRATYQSIGRPLPKRRNIVISSAAKAQGLLEQDGIEVFNKVQTAIESCDGPTWLIGGESIYNEGMQYANKIYLTMIPEFVDVQYKKHAKFPWVNPKMFELQESEHTEDGLEVLVYSRR